MSKILIGVAWPYANGTIHLGHLAGSLLPPDIFRRYNVMIGNETLMVSGSDQHGTPITVTAEREGTTPLEVAERFHAINKKAIEDMGIEFSLFTKTHTPNHTKTVQRIFLELLKKDLLYKKETMQYYCPECSKFLPDRYVEGTCPECGCGARGDQCDKCGKIFETGDLKDAMCRHCSSPPEIRETEHFFLRLSAFRDRLTDYLKGKDWWRSNVVSFTRNWLEGELKDRPITRDMDWGVPVPLDGWGGKVIYVWFDAVIGYLSASIEYSDIIGDNDMWKSYWKDENVRHYYFLGKDNIPFHSIIWPSILLGYGHLNLPYDIPANEYLMHKGGKLSKSKGGAIEIPAVLETYDADIIRYYLSVNMPDTHDSDFTWDDFRTKVNNELVSALGNFYHRCLSFTKKNFGIVPDIKDVNEHEKIEVLISSSITEYRKHMDSCDFKKAIRTVMDLAHSGNRYFDSVKPWALIKTDKEECGSVLNANLRIVKALAVMAWPFMPRSSETIWKYLGIETSIDKCGFDHILDPFTGETLAEPSPVYGRVELQLQEDEHMDRKDLEKQAFGDFGKLDIRVGRITDAKDHPNAEKLFVLKVNVGENEDSQIVAGLKAYYTAEQIKGRSVLAVCNLKPAKLRGELSNGMLLAADDEDNGGSNVMLLKPSANVPAGTKMDCGIPGNKGSIEYKEFQKAVMKVAAVKNGSVSSDGSTADTDAADECIAVVIDDGIMPITDGNGCYATTDGKMDGARIR